MILKILFIFFIISLQAGCFGMMNGLRDKRVELYKSSSSNSDYLIIYKTIHNNCGCTTVSVEKFVKGNLVYLISYACPTDLLPYRQVKQYDSLNNLISKVCYRATDTGNFDFPLTDEDRQVIHLLDSLTQADREKVSDYRFCTKSITGFNKIDCMY